ncbi:MAG TPA: PAS domain-containing protein [Actinomycetes bacterium]
MVHEPRGEVSGTAVLPRAHRDFDAESLLRSLMQNVPGAIYRCAMDGFWKMQRVSEEIESISGYPASDFVDASRRTLVSVTHPDDRDAVDDQIKAAIAAHQPYALEFRVIHADGSIRWVLERGMKTVDRDGEEWLDGIIFDITARKAAEDQRLQRETEAARITELEASRARIIEAADAARHRIERDLHDGAQQRLIVASLHLAAAERAVQRGGDAGDHLRSARDALEAGVVELRELAHGIHPSVLTLRGLGQALRALCEHSSLTVELHDELGQRLDPTVEAALYYTVSEALTNVSRYSGATSAVVHLSRCDDIVEVEVSDSGCGGADPTRGSGLHGLQDRLGAVSGILEIDSPPGGGTVLRARVPIS